MAMSAGTIVERVHCVPDSAQFTPKQHDIPRVHEGSNHKVRELVKNVRPEVHSLKCVRIRESRLSSDRGLEKHVELKQSELEATSWKS